MQKLSWGMRCLPALTALALMVLTAITFFDVPTLVVEGFGKTNHSSRKTKHVADSWTLLQAFWCFYVIVLHGATWIYNFRLGYGLLRTTSRIKRNSENEARLDHVAPPPGAIQHMIMLPAYKEEVDTLEETLDVFACHDQAKTDYHFYLAMEEKDPNAVSVAEDMVARYANKFATIQYTIHPAGIPGESPGKSSNISWCAKQIMDKYGDSPSKANIILTVMDADTHLQQSYFTQCTRAHQEALASPGDSSMNKTGETYDPNLTIYAPPIVFDRNAHVIPGFVRQADLLWTAAAMSGLFPGSAIGTPTSVYSVPLPLAIRVGGWDTNAVAIGEDLHMMCKCFFSTRGAMRVNTIYSPASQCNVASDMSGFRGYLDSLRARWRQAIRHMWGSLDTGYSYQRGYALLSEILATPKQAVDMPSFSEKKPDQENGIPQITLGYFLWRFIPLYHRLFEAHMLPMQLTAAMLSCVAYTALVPPVVTPWMLQSTFDITGYMRGVGWCMMACNFMLYERYHALSVGLREKTMKRNGLSNGATFSRRNSLVYWLDYALFPVSGILFGSAPAIVAQICHFWTEDLVYHVSAKPKRVVQLDDGKVVEVIDEKIVNVLKEGV